MGFFHLRHRNRRRGGEPSVEEKHAEAVTRPEKIADHPAIGSDHPPANDMEELYTIGGVDVYKASPFPAVIYLTGMNIDADGAPEAYHPKPDDELGLDHLGNAGAPGNWWGIVTANGKSNGEPVIQGSGDPAPGFYVSATALENSGSGGALTHPSNYVDASTIPFIVLPGGHENLTGRLGDLAAVVNFSNGKVAYAISADIGPSDKLGEGSIALAEELGVPGSPKHGGVGSGIGYCFFPGSGTGRPQPKSEIDATASDLFNKFGGIDMLHAMLLGTDD